MSLRTLARRFIHGIGHVQAPIPKHVENSNRGDRRAKRQGKDGNDLDLQITKADPNCPLVGHPEHVDGECLGHILNTHWLQVLLRDRFRDPQKKIGLHARIDHLVLAQALRLVAGRRPRRYHIRTIEQALTHCARIGLVAVLEPKGDHRFRQDWVWQYIRKVAEQVGCTVSVRALPENAAALAPAARAGFKTWEIR